MKSYKVDPFLSCILTIDASLRSFGFFMAKNTSSPSKAKAGPRRSSRNRSLQRVNASLTRGGDIQKPNRPKSMYRKKRGQSVTACSSCYAAKRKVCAPFEEIADIHSVKDSTVMNPPTITPAYDVARKGPLAICQRERSS